MTKPHRVQFQRKRKEKSRVLRNAYVHTDVGTVVPHLRAVRRVHQGPAKGEYPSIFLSIPEDQEVEFDGQCLSFIRNRNVHYFFYGENEGGELTKIINDQGIVVLGRMIKISPSTGHIYESFPSNSHEDDADADDPILELWKQIAKSGRIKDTVINYTREPAIFIGAFNRKRGIHYITIHHYDRLDELLQQFSRWKKRDRTRDVEWVTFCRIPEFLPNYF